MDSFKNKSTLSLLVIVSALLFVAVESAPAKDAAVEEVITKLEVEASKVWVDDFETIENLRHLMTSSKSTQLKNVEATTTTGLNLNLIRGLAVYLPLIMNTEVRKQFGKSKLPKKAGEDEAQYQERVKFRFNHAFEDRVIESCQELNKHLATPVELYHKLKMEGESKLNQLKDTLNEDGMKWIYNGEICAEILAQSEQILAESYKVASMNNLL